MKLRSLFALALAALLVPVVATAAPAPRAAPAAKTRSVESASPMDNVTIGGFVGYESDDLSGPALRLDAEVPFRALAPQVNLSWVGSIGFSHLSKDVGGYGVSADWTANILKLIPAARFSFAVNPQFTLFADGGLGLYYASQTVEAVAWDPFNGYYKVSGSKSETSLMMRIGGGAWYEVNPKTRIGASIEFDPYFGDFDQNTFVIQAGAMFKL